MSEEGTVERQRVFQLEQKATLDWDLIFPPSLRRKKIFGNGIRQQMCGHKKRILAELYVPVLLVSPSEQKDIFPVALIITLNVICGSMIPLPIPGRRKRILAECRAITLL